MVILFLMVKRLMVRNRVNKLRNWFVESRWFSKTLQQVWMNVPLLIILFLKVFTIIICSKMKKNVKRKLKILSVKWGFLLSIWLVTLMSFQVVNVNVSVLPVPWSCNQTLLLRMSPFQPWTFLYVPKSWTCSKNSKKNSVWPISL